MTAYAAAWPVAVLATDWSGSASAADVADGAELGQSDVRAASAQAAANVSQQQQQRKKKGKICSHSARSVSGSAARQQLQAGCRGRPYRRLRS